MPEDEKQDYALTGKRVWVNGHRGIVQVVHLLRLWYIVLIHQRPSSTRLITMTPPHTVDRRILRGLPTLLLGGAFVSDAKQYILLDE